MTNVMQDGQNKLIYFFLCKKSRFKSTFAN